MPDRPSAGEAAKTFRKLFLETSQPLLEADEQMENDEEKVEEEIEGQIKED